MGIALKPAPAWLRVPALGALAFAVVLISGCGGGGGSSAGPASTNSTEIQQTAPVDWPPTRNRSFRRLVGNMLQGPELAPSVTVLQPGRNRFGFALFDRSRRQIGGLQTALYISKGLDETAHGPFPARYERIDVKPQFQSQTSAQDPDSAQAVYVADIPFPSAGSYLVTAVTKFDRKLVATSPGQVTVSSSSAVPQVGEKAIAVHTPTVTSVHGNVQSIDTRVPPDDMHKVDLVDALKNHRPVVLLFATPALCQSRVCGPVVDVTEQVKAQYGDRVDFIHMEIYRDNDISKGPRPQFTAYGLRHEPILFAIDRRGVIAARLEGAFSVSELEDTVRKVLR